MHQYVDTFEFACIDFTTTSMTPSTHSTTHNAVSTGVEMEFQLPTIAGVTMAIDGAMVTILFNIFKLHTTPLTYPTMKWIIFYLIL